MEPRLLFIHGAGCNHTVWVFQRKVFGKKGVFLDLPGHYVAGRGKRSISEYVEYIKNFCDRKGLRNVVIIGHSMGGAIAQAFTLKHPEYVKAIVLVSTGAKLRVAPVIFEAIRKNYEDAVEFMVNLLFSSGVKNEIKQKAILELKKIRPEVTYGDFEACNKFDVMEQVTEIKVPTLIICGAEDLLTPLSYSNYLKRHIPNSKLEVINNAGHMVMLEKSQEFNEKLAEFLKEIYKQSPN